MAISSFSLTNVWVDESLTVHLHMALIGSMLQKHTCRWSRSNFELEIRTFLYWFTANPKILTVYSNTNWLLFCGQNVLFFVNWTYFFRPFTETTTVILSFCFRDVQYQRDGRHLGKSFKNVLKILKWADWYHTHTSGELQVAACQLDWAWLSVKFRKMEIRWSIYDSIGYDNQICLQASLKFSFLYVNKHKLHNLIFVLR